MEDISIITAKKEKAKKAENSDVSPSLFENVFSVFLHCTYP